MCACVCLFNIMGACTPPLSPDLVGGNSNSSLSAGVTGVNRLLAACRVETVKNKKPFPSTHA